MPSIQDLVSLLRQRDGVEAAIVLGRDGLVIASDSQPGVDSESLAALLPSVVSAADELGQHTGRGALTTALLEYPGGVVLVSPMSADAILMVLSDQGPHLGPLILELRRHCEHLASLA